MTDFLAEIFL